MPTFFRAAQAHRQGSRVQGDQPELSSAAEAFDVLPQHLYDFRSLCWHKYLHRLAQEAVGHGLTANVDVLYLPCTVTFDGEP